MSVKKYALGIIGIGNMAEAILKGVLNSGFLIPAEINIFEKSKDRVDYINKNFNIKLQKSLDELIKASRYILVSVKPKDVPGVIEEMKSCRQLKEKTVISIAAGISTVFYEKNIPGNISVIRIMPNTPAFLNKGISAISKGRFSDDKDIAFASAMIKSVGEYIIVEEIMQNIITAVSGSGPAYFFLFCQYLIEAAVRLGLDKKTASMLVTETATGSSEMLKSFNSDTRHLIKMVASPGGTTEAALMEFDKNNLNEIIHKALSAAEKRALEIQDEIESYK